MKNEVLLHVQPSLQHFAPNRYKLKGPIGQPSMKVLPKP